MSRRRRVLVVDPNEGVRELVASILEDRGYRVSRAEGGAMMRRILAEARFDAVIMYASLRGEASASLAEHAKGLRLPVVMISGNDLIMGYAADQGLQLLRKPFRIQELCDALDDALASGEFGQRCG